MNDDSAMMMDFPTRDQFIASYLRQYFSLPYSTIYYILKNPHSSKVYQKLIQCCKYFFIKNPILVFHCLKIDNAGWKICSEDCAARTFTKNINVNIGTLSGCKLWIQERLNIHSTNSNYGSLLIPNIYQCDAEKLNIKNQHISLQQLSFISQHVKRVGLQKVIINSDIDSEVPLEKIIANLPFVEIFVYDPTPTNKVSSGAVKKLLEIPHFKNIYCFWMKNASEEFDIEAFYNYFKNENSKFSFLIEYQNLPSADYERKLDEFNSEILDIGTIPDRLAGIFVYPGQDETKRNALLDLCRKTYHAYAIATIK